MKKIVQIITFLGMICVIGFIVRVTVFKDNNKDMNDQLKSTELKQSEPFQCENYDENTFYVDGDWYYSRHAKMYKTVWDTYAETDTAYKSPEEFLNEIDKNVKCISEFLKKPDWEKQYRGNEDREIIITVSTTTGKPRMTGGAYGEAMLELPSYLVNLDLSPLTHEITHLIAPNNKTNNYAYSLKEGLATYMTEMMGYPGAHRLGAPVHSLAKQFLNEEHQALIDVIGLQLPSMDYYFDHMYAFYNLSNSFTKFLIEEYGLEKFMLVYMSDYLVEDYSDTYGKSYEELKQEWIEMLEYEESYEYTFEELHIRYYGITSEGSEK
ncbi:gluzincin family metallopeptidase [Haloplasma contractile]|uniref:Peptidase MA superfamily protein n=1 Tax=Haloplasma contractile SSD-17B TaxID=1033810 RepID=U2FQ21_9MOLU|nr:hypothetical protein [Haloplasma contractile]ERJ13144.1 Peptidase MA superfamily protein [Haloplasma contractile SSD-17B]